MATTSLFHPVPPRGLRVTPEGHGSLHALPCKPEAPASDRRETGSFSALPSKPEAPARDRPAGRRGFTLVELLVVIGIIAVLAGIITPAVMRAQASARNAAIKAEIDMLHMAIMNYKNEYGSFPPCDDDTSYGVNGPAAKHLKRLFPRCNTTVEFGQAISLLPSTKLTPSISLVSWLNGFRAEPDFPITGTSDQTRLYDFDRSRLASTNPTNIPRTQFVYFPSSKPESPYIYINNAAYGTVTSPKSFVIQPTVYVPKSSGYDTVNLNTTQYTPQIQILTSGTSFFNPTSFQILCAGRDGVFSEDANMNDTFDAGEDLNGNGVFDRSDDDLSNFWPGTRRDYMDSLNQ